MTVIAVALKHMLAAGMPHEAIVAAVAEMEASAPKDAQAERRRTADRERKHRLRNSAESADTVPPKEIPPVPPLEITPSDHPSELTLACPKGRDLETAFEEFWTAYPKRDGSNPKEPARKKFAAALKSGVPLESLLAGARNYALEVRRLGQIETPFVKQAAVWLNQKCWQDYATASSATGPPGLEETPEVWKTRLDYGRTKQRWHCENWGPMPGTPGCRVPRDLLESGDGTDWAEWQRAA